MHEDHSRWKDRNPENVGLSEGQAAQSHHEDSEMSGPGNGTLSTSAQEDHVEDKHKSSRPDIGVIQCGEEEQRRE